MKTTILVLGVVASMLLGTPAVIVAAVASQQNDWGAVRGVPVGTKVRIETRDGQGREGQLSSVSDSVVSITRSGAPERIARADVRRLYTVDGGRSRGKSTAIGAAIGAGAGAGGAGILLGATGGSDETNAVFAIGIAIGAAIGAGIGAALGRGSKRTLIYET